MARFPITFENEGQQLFGVIHRPEGDANQSHPGVAIFHGFLGSKDNPHRIFVQLADAVAQAGMIALRVDLRGRGDSEGDSIDITPQADLSDARKTLDVLTAQPGVDSARIGIVGMSWGGVLAAALAGEDQRVKSSVLWSSVPVERFNWNPDFQTFDGREAAENWGLLVGKQFYEALPNFNPLSAMRTAHSSIQLIYGTADESVSTDDLAAFEETVRTANIRYEIVPIEGADHIFMDYRLKCDLIERTLRWLREELR
jgi:dienelactone hydrolase